MTSHDSIPPTDEALRWQLRALHQDMPPTRDLWPGIAARLATSPRHQAPVRPRRPWTPFALAASVLLAITVTWQLQQAPTGDPLIQREAAALTRDYAGALAQLDRQVAAPQRGDCTTAMPCACRRCTTSGAGWPKRLR